MKKHREDLRGQGSEPRGKTERSSPPRSTSWGGGLMCLLDFACSAVACSAVACSAVACSAVACSAVACLAVACSPGGEEKPQDDLPMGSGAMGGSAGGTGSEENGPEKESEHGSPLQSKAPVRSTQGTGCSVKNDCEDGFSCIRGLCQAESFGIEATGKECYQIDCTETADCCGHLETDISEECRSRAAKCLETLPGCSAGEECTSSSDCSGGGVCSGNCSVSEGNCTGNVDCLANRCVDGFCSLNFTPCSSNAECAANTCTGGSCDCSNPSYDPADPVCENEECEELCRWACEESRCVIRSDCQDNEDCFGARSLCDEGSCVECKSSTDCSFDRICLSGRCEKLCQNDTHCPLFEACDSGQCIYVGCRSDRECTLIPDVESVGLSSGVDPRLLRCHTEDGIGKCIIPCQTDAQCPTTEVCSGGVCEYIGCETDAECKTIVGAHDQDAAEELPWVSKVECRSPED